MNLQNFLDSDRRILVVGDVMLDQYFEGVIDRISPEAPVPVLKVTERFNRPGGAANVALNIAALGLPVSLLAYVGDDPEADLLKTELINAGVECHFLTTKNACTVVKLRALSRRQQMLRLDFEESFVGEDHAALITRFEQLAKTSDLVVFSDYAKGTLSEVETMIATARSYGKPTLVDPKGSDFGRYRNADLLTPNFSEFSLVVGEIENEEMLHAKANALLSRHSFGAVIVTRGEAGMTLVEPTGEPLTIAAEAQEVYDVTGAGDTVIATLAATLATGLDTKEAMRIANAAAAIVVSRKGTSAVSALDLAKHITSKSGTEDSDGDPMAQILQARESGQSIVMTNGCFDILHAGHISYLEAAKRMGDRLVVAINSDASVTRLKGPARPINRLEHRMKMLNALKCVDWVVSFDGSQGVNGGWEDTPRDIIKQIRPNILVKGGDYKKAEIVGADEIESYGGKVEVLPFVDGLSSSAILQLLEAAG